MMKMVWASRLLEIKDQLVSNWTKLKLQSPRIPIWKEAVGVEVVKQNKYLEQTSSKTKDMTIGYLALKS